MFYRLSAVDMMSAASEAKNWMADRMSAGVSVQNERAPFSKFSESLLKNPACQVGGQAAEFVPFTGLQNDRIADHSKA